MGVEAKENEVNVNMTVKTLNAVLEYIYTGQVTGETSDYSELLGVADMYELPGLVAQVFNMFKTLDDEDAVHVLIMAGQARIGGIQEPLEKIVNNRDRFLKDKKFKEKMVSYPQLLLQLL